MKALRVSIGIFSVVLGAQSRAWGESSAAGTPPAASSVRVEQPRAFGYSIGDVLVQRIEFDDRAPAFGPQALPKPGPIDVWWERRSARLEQGALGRQTLVVEYQLMNAPRTLTAVRLPAWSLPARPGLGAVTIPEWPVMVTPLTLPVALDVGDLQTLRPDRPAPQLATDASRLRFQLGLIAFACTLVAWITWCAARNWRARSRLPFAHARRVLRRIEPTDPRAWQALHRAFDQTGGRVIQSANLAVLFERAPALASMRNQIEAFYSESARRFFEPGSHWTPQPLHELCIALCRIERRSEV
ncbi:MAG: calcium incorporation protein MxaA [Burkholderiaceae bacterium]